MKAKFISALAAASIALAIASSGAQAAKPIVGLITKTESNPFFVKMREGAQTTAAKLGLDLRTFAGKYDGDNEAQVNAIENLISAGAAGIAIVPADSAAIVPTIKKARDAGILVIVLDTPLEPMDAAEATFATDNRAAGNMIGAWAKGMLGDKAKSAKIVFLDVSPNQPTVDYLRDQGFMQGFGIDVKNPNRIGDENDPRICSHEMSEGDAAKGRTGMENALQKCPGVNLVYAVNESAGAGAYEALKQAGVEKDVLIVAVDGSCPGVKNIADGVIDATAQQYPLKMAALALEAIAKFAADGTRPKVGENGFFDTGANLITATPVKGVPSLSVDEGLKLCF